MITVMRFGSMMQIPHRLSHHVPRVPVLETDNYVEKTPWRYGHSILIIISFFQVVQH